jgi:sRNA-binding carbon storage regulator CsrA
MLMLKNPEATEKRLVLGDYMTVQVSRIKASQVYNAEPGDMQVRREELHQRIQKQRGELVPRVQKTAGDLIDVRLRVAGADQIGWDDFSEVMNEDNKVVA